MAAGRLAELYYESAAYAAYDGSGLTKITKAQDITEDDSMAEIVESDRAAILNGTSVGQRTYSFSFNYHYDTATDAVWTALRGAYTGDTTLNFAVCDGPKATSGTHIVWIEGRIASMGRSYPLEGSMVVPIKVVLANGANIEDKTVS